MNPLLAKGLSINGSHALRDGPKRRDLLRVSGKWFLKTAIEPLALRSRLFLAASRRAPAGENRQSPSEGARGRLLARHFKTSPDPSFVRRETPD
jgi:hypothetical protein